MMRDQQRDPGPDTNRHNNAAFTHAGSLALNSYSLSAAFTYRG
jgi:hypothetical protein